MRESSRVVIVPMNQPFTGSVPDIVDKAMDHASRSLPELVGLAHQIKSKGPDRVGQLSDMLLPMMGNVDVRGRLAKNYAMSMFFAELVSE